MEIEIKKEEISSLEWALLKAMELTKSDKKFIDLQKIDLRLQELKSKMNL